jgi:hypothetical protein
LTADELPPARRLQFAGIDPIEARVLSTNALRLTVPPATLRRGTESLITAIVDYVRGDTRRLDADVVLPQVLGGIDDTAVIEARTVLAGAADGVFVSIDDYRVAIRALAASSRPGRFLMRFP